MNACTPVHCDSSGHLVQSLIDAVLSSLLRVNAFILLVQAESLLKLITPVLKRNVVYEIAR